MQIVNSIFGKISLIVDLLETIYSNAQVVSLHCAIYVL